MKIFKTVQEAFAWTFDEKEDLFDMDVRKVEFRFKMALTEKTDEMIG